MLFLLVSILKSNTFLVVQAQRGFDSPPACDKYSVVDRHSLRVCLLLYANIAFSLHLPLPRLIWYINVFNVREAKGVGSKPWQWRHTEGGVLLQIGCTLLESCVVMGCSCRWLFLPVGHCKHHLDYTDSLPCIIQGMIWNCTQTRGGKSPINICMSWAEMGGNARQNNLPAFQRHVTVGLTVWARSLQQPQSQLSLTGARRAIAQPNKEPLSFRSSTVVSLALYLSYNSTKWAIIRLQADR